MEKYKGGSHFKKINGDNSILKSILHKIRSKEPKTEDDRAVNIHLSYTVLWKMSSFLSLHKAILTRNLIVYIK